MKREQNGEHQERVKRKFRWRYWLYSLTSRMRTSFHVTFALCVTVVYRVWGYIYCLHSSACNNFFWYKIRRAALLYVLQYTQIYCVMLRLNIRRHYQVGLKTLERQVEIRETLVRKHCCISGFYFRIYLHLYIIISEEVFICMLLNRKKQIKFYFQM